MLTISIVNFHVYCYEVLPKGIGDINLSYARGPGVLARLLIPILITMLILFYSSPTSTFNPYLDPDLPRPNSNHTFCRKPFVGFWCFVVCVVSGFIRACCHWLMPLPGGGVGICTCELPTGLGAHLDTDEKDRTVLPVWIAFITANVTNIPVATIASNSTSTCTSHHHLNITTTVTLTITLTVTLTMTITITILKDEEEMAQMLDSHGDGKLARHELLVKMRRKFGSLAAVCKDAELRRVHQIPNHPSSTDFTSPSLSFSLSLFLSFSLFLFLSLS